MGSLAIFDKATNQPSHAVQKRDIMSSLRVLYVMAKNCETYECSRELSGAILHESCSTIHDHENIVRTRFLTVFYRREMRSLHHSPGTILLERSCAPVPKARQPALSALARLSVACGSQRRGALSRYGARNDA